MPIKFGVAMSGKGPAIDPAFVGAVTGTIANVVKDDPQ
jgi:hypothetical protein